MARSPSPRKSSAAMPSSKQRRGKRPRRSRTSSWSCIASTCRSSNASVKSGRSKTTNALPEHFLEARRVSAPHRPVDDKAAERQDGEGGCPEHREDQAAVTEPLTAVDAVDERLVGVGVFLDQCTAAGIEHQQAILAAAGPAQVNG